MSLITFYYKDQPRGNIGGVSIDATIHDAVGYSSQVTNYPVEDGSFISDNITIQPINLTLRGLISDTPLLATNTHENIGYNEESNSRVKNAYEKLLDLYFNKEPFDVVTGLDVYEDVFFVSFDINRNADTGLALSFVAKFQNIEYATPKIVPIPREKVRVEKKDFAQSDINKGAEQVSDAETKRKSVSILYKLFGSRYSETGAAA